MKSAFTMIELIFIIVIIGILASVALPKLMATRSDARGAVVVNNLVTCINDAGNEYIKNGTFNGTTTGEHASTACRLAAECFDFEEHDANGTLSVNNKSDSEGKGCNEAQEIARKNLLSTTHNFHF